MPIPDVNLESIPDLATRQLVGQLLNLIEALVAENAAQRLEIQQLRDELARLKGASPKPEIKPAVPPAATDHSSEAERQPPTPRGKPKAAKNATLTVTHEQRCAVDPALLPPGAIRNGTTESIVQDLRLVPEVIRFVREVWFVPSTGQPITAPLPAGYAGGFGPHLRASVWTLGHGASISQPALLSFLTDLGLDVAAGTIGLASGPWQATDQTSTRVDGQTAESRLEQGILSQAPCRIICEGPVEQIQQVMAQSTNPTGTRSRSQIQQLLDGLELVPPGLVWLPEWRRESPDDVLLDQPERSSALAAVGQRVRGP
jgi:hypothetical protein